MHPRVQGVDKSTVIGYDLASTKPTCRFDLILIALARSFAPGITGCTYWREPIVDKPDLAAVSDDSLTGQALGRSHISRTYLIGRRPPYLSGTNFGQGSRGA